MQVAVFLLICQATKKLYPVSGKNPISTYQRSKKPGRLPITGSALTGLV